MSKFEELITLLTSKGGRKEDEQKTDSLHRIALVPLPQCLPEEKDEPVTDRFAIAEQATIECPAVAKVARSALSLSERRIYASLIGACVNHMHVHGTRPFSILIAKEDAPRIAAQIGKVENVYRHSVLFAGCAVQITTNAPTWVTRTIPGGVVTPGIIYTIS